MNRRGFGLLLRSVASVILACSLMFQVVGPTRVAAQDASPASAADVNAFVADPAGWLANFNANTADGAKALALAIQNIALAADGRTPAIIQSLLAASTTSANAQIALATGLGNAASQMGNPNSASYNPSFATSIQSAVAAAGLSTASQSAYNTAAGGTQTASTGAQGGGGGGGGANPTNSSQPGGGGGAGSSGAGGSTGTGNASGGLTGGGGGGTAGSGNTNLAGSVSPFR